MVNEQEKDDLLEMMYRMTHGELNKIILLELVKIHLNWDKDKFLATAQALEHDNLIVLRSQMGHSALTLHGHRRVEARLNPSPTFTQNTIAVGTATNSPIQQGGAHATMAQTVSYNAQDLDDLHRLVDVFENHLDDLGLDPAAKRKAMVQVATIKLQLEDEPDPVILNQAGRTLRNITEGAIGSLVATGALNPAVWATVTTIMLKLFGGP